MGLFSFINKMWRWLEVNNPLQCFKQVWAELYHKKCKSKCRDKWHHIRHVTKTLNITAKTCFIHGLNICFDQWGIVINSCLCPIHEYNKEKHNKFIVDLFIISDDKEYFIYKIDVYQENNTNNIVIAEEIQSLPNTQKDVTNAILSVVLYNDP